MTRTRTRKRDREREGEKREAANARRHVISVSEARARRWNEQNKGGVWAGRKTGETFAVAWISLHREFDRLSCIRHLAVNCREEPRSRNCPYAYWMFVLPSVIQCADIDTPGTREAYGKSRSIIYYAFLLVRWEECFVFPNKLYEILKFVPEVPAIFPFIVEKAILIKISNINCNAPSQG